MHAADENRTLSLRERWIAAGVLLAVMLLSVAVVKGGILFTRPLWLDEYHTALVASRSTPVEVVSDVAHGADYAPPLLHVIVWTSRLVTGGVTPVLLRTISFVCVWLAAWLVFLTMRRRFDLPPAVAAALGVWSHTQVVTHAFEGRFYGLWLLCAAGLAWSLGWRDERASDRTRGVAVGVFAVLLCMTHWLAVITLGLAVLGVLWVYRGRLREGVRRVLPACAGLVAVLIASPMALGQRQAISAPTWVLPLNTGQVIEMADTFYVALIPVIAMAVRGLRALSGKPTASPSPLTAPRAPLTASRAPRTASLRDPGVAALAVQGLMPIAIALFSIVVQPSMLPRYAIVTALAWAPLVAIAMSALGAKLRWSFLALIVLLGVSHVQLQAEEKRAFAQHVAADVAAEDVASRAGVPIVFQARHVMYPVASERPDRRSASLYLALDDAMIDRMYPVEYGGEQFRKLFKVERDVARVHERLFGFPRIVTQSELAAMPRFLLLASDASLPPGYKSSIAFGQIIASRDSARRVSPNLTLFVRR